MAQPGDLVLDERDMLDEADDDDLVLDDGDVLSGAAPPGPSPPNGKLSSEALQAEIAELQAETARLEADIARCTAHSDVAAADDRDADATGSPQGADNAKLASLKAESEKWRTVASEKEAEVEELKTLLADRDRELVNLRKQRDA